MVDFLTDVAGLSMIIGVISMYYGLSMYKWNPGWRIIAAPLAILGVMELAVALTILVNATMGILVIFLFGGVTSYALFRIGQENM